MKEGIFETTEAFLFLSVFVFWWMHVWRCIAVDDWLFLIIGVAIWPIGVVHGVGVLFGVW
jgi:hypothetical protein